MPAFAHEIAAAKREGVKIIPQVAPVEFVGTDRVTGVRASACGWAHQTPPAGRARSRFPARSSSSRSTRSSRRSVRSRTPNCWRRSGVEMKGSVVQIDDDMRTTVHGLYAGGDCINGGSTVVQAVRDGKKAARAIDRSLAGTRRSPLPDPQPRTSFRTTAPSSTSRATTGSRPPPSCARGATSASPVAPPAPCGSTRPITSRSRTPTPASSAGCARPAAPTLRSGSSRARRSGPASSRRKERGVLSMRPQRLIQGNEACAHAALYAGCNFYAGYPITPSCEVMEILSHEMPARGGSVHPDGGRDRLAHPPSSAPRGAGPRP